MKFQYAIFFEKRIGVVSVVSVINNSNNSLLKDY